MNAELTIDELTGVELEVRNLIADAVDLRVAGDSQASFDLLSGSEHLVESVSVSRQGRFFNQRALALKDLKEYDRAILEFDRAAYCFEQSGETQLRGMVHNNIASAYSLAGNHARALESVRTALGLATEEKYLIQWGDQLANILLAAGKTEEAQAEINKVLRLLCGNQDFGLMQECLGTQISILKQERDSCAVSGKVVKGLQSSDFHLPQPKRGPLMSSTAMECVQAILNTDYQAALPLFSLIAMIADPNGDPDRYSVAWAAMQFLFVHTPRGEQELASLVEEIQQPVREVSEVSS